MGNSFEKRRNRGFLGPSSEALSTSESRQRRKLRSDIDLNGFNLRVFVIGASGFLTDSYNLFATNVILPSLAFVYWREATSPWRETLINAMTLAGSIVGQLLFGWLADRFGRTRLYGIELIIVVFSTIGVASASTGYGNDMAILAWFSVWRFVMGVGIGAEYPLSAIVVAEWASTRARAKMMSAVFLMQPLGQLLAQAFGVFVLLGFNSHNQLKECSGTEPSDTCLRSVDRLWRVIVGIGAVPALFAIISRFLIWDSGVYELEVRKEIPRALRNTARVYRNARASSGSSIELQGPGHRDNSEQKAESRIQFSLRDLYVYFIDEGNWRYLAGTSICWFLLDFSFYGLGMGNPRTLAKISTTWNSPDDISTPPSWNTNPTEANTIYDVLFKNGIQSMETVSIASLIGSILFVFVVDYFPRREWLIISFLLQAVLFIITGGSFYAVFHKDSHSVTVTLVAICHFLFNFGANTLTFMIPAEIFPTCYRCTCHGIAAAAGKLGSVIVLIILHYLNSSDPNSKKLGWIFIIFGCVMAVGAIFAWAWIPDVQTRRDESGGLRLPSRTLEELGQGIGNPNLDWRQKVGFRRRWNAWRVRTADSDSS